MSNGFDASSYVVKADGARCILTIRFRQNRFWNSNGRAIGHRATHRTCDVRILANRGDRTGRVARGAKIYA